MFSDLRQQIHQSTVGRKFPAPDKVSRTFFLLASSSLFHLKDWFQQWFPISNKDLVPFYPWLLMGEDEDALRDDMAGAVAEAFSADRVLNVSAQGISILDNVNQVLLVADLCDDDAYSRVVDGAGILRDEIRQISGTGSPVYWSALFILRRPEASNMNGEEAEAIPAFTRILSAGEDALHRLGKDLPQQLFDRVFLLDVSNPQGMLVDEAEDLHCLAGHLLYFLTTYPLEATSLDEYVEWLHRSRARDGEVSSLSAFSLVLPIDQILEAVTVFKGAEVMDRALLNDVTLDRFHFYLNRFLQENRLLQLDEVKTTVSEDADFPLQAPLKGLPDFFKSRPVDYLTTVEERDASLPRIAEENGQVIEQIGEQRQRTWKESLEDHLETMIGRESGGLLKAGQFLHTLEEHLRHITPKRVEPAKYGEPWHHLSELQVLLRRGPRKEAIYGRALVLAVISDVIVVAFPLGFLATVLLLVALPALFLGLAVFLAHAARQALENNVLALERLLHEKWDALMETERLKASQKKLEALIATVQQARGDVETAHARVKELVAYFQDEYRPPFPAAFAFWKYVTEERDILLRFAPQCNPDLASVTKSYLEEDHPLLPWRRLAAAGSGQPNPWECHVAEQAALRLLPACGALLNLRVLDLLEAGTPQLKGNKMAMIRGGQPFLNLRPEATHIERYAVLETEPEDQEPVVAELREAFSQYFRHVRRIGPRSPYRLSFFGFLEGAEIDDVLLR